MLMLLPGALLLSGCVEMAALALEAEAQEREAEQQAQEAEEESVPMPQNVILVIGDGMGVPQVYASVVAAMGNNSAFLRFPYSGFSRTYSRNKYRTDSAAGGTALTTGHKVDNWTTTTSTGVPTRPAMRPSSTMPSVPA